MAPNSVFVFCTLFLAVCLGGKSDLKFVVTVTSGAVRCNSLIRTSAILQTLCSCVAQEKGGTVVPHNLEFISVTTRTGKKQVSHVIPHTSCKKTDGIFVYNSALVFLSDQIDLINAHAPVREPAIAHGVFDEMMGKKKPCSLFDVRYKLARLIDCFDVSTCTDQDCTVYLNRMTFCMQPESVAKVALNGSPLVCSSGLVWGVKLFDTGNYTLFMKTIVFDELEKSCSSGFPVLAYLLALATLVNL